MPDMKFSIAMKDILIDWLHRSIISQDYAPRESPLPSQETIRILSFVCAAPAFALFKDEAGILDYKCSVALQHILDDGIKDERLDLEERRHFRNKLLLAIGPRKKTPNVNKVLTEIRSITFEQES